MDHTASDQRWTILQVIKDRPYCKWSKMDHTASDQR